MQPFTIFFFLDKSDDYSLKNPMSLTKIKRLLFIIFLTILVDQCVLLQDFLLISLFIVSFLLFALKLIFL